MVGGECRRVSADAEGRYEHLLVQDERVSVACYLATAYAAGIDTHDIVRSPVAVGECLVVSGSDIEGVVICMGGRDLLH